MSFNIDNYLKQVDRDFDYYLFWADEFHDKYEDELVELDSMEAIQIECTKLLMSEGQAERCKEDGFILGEIIFYALREVPLDYVRSSKTYKVVFGESIKHAATYECEADSVSEACTKFREAFGFNGLKIQHIVDPNGDKYIMDYRKGWVK